MRKNLIVNGMATLLALLALTACATVPEYSRDGATEQQLEDNLDSCRAQARRLQSREEAITRDIRASRADSLRPGAADFINEIEDLRPTRQYDEIVDECMRRSGYESTRQDTKSLWQQLTGG